VSRFRDASHDMGMPISDPPEYEEGRGGPMFIQQLENGINILGNSAGHLMPLVAPDYPFKRVDLKILFNINSEDVRRRHS
jgi:hypothetical protein